MNVYILFSINSNAFQALMQEIKSQRVIMIAFMEKIKQQYQSILEKLRERGQLRQKVASKLERRFSNELRGQHSKNLGESDEFYRSPMQAEVNYLFPHGREGGTLDNVAGEIINAAMAITP